jgi:hypothetical protein
MGTSPDFAAFDSQEHTCCKIVNELPPHTFERMIAAKQNKHESERRAAKRYLAILTSPDATRI